MKIAGLIDSTKRYMHGQRDSFCSITPDALIADWVKDGAAYHIGNILSLLSMREIGVSDQVEAIVAHLDKLIVPIEARPYRGKQKYRRQMSSVGNSFNPASVISEWDYDASSWQASVINYVYLALSDYCTEHYVTHLRLARIVAIGEINREEFVLTA